MLKRSSGKSKNILRGFIKIRTNLPLEDRELEEKPFVLIRTLIFTLKSKKEP